MQQPRKGSIKDNVLTLLKDHPYLRDNDGQLSLYYQVKFFDGGPTQFIASNIQVEIRTLRQDLQREKPELRGEKWKVRHSKGVKEAKLRSMEKPEVILEESGFIRKKLGYKRNLFNLFGLLG